MKCIKLFQIPRTGSNSIGVLSAIDSIKIITTYSFIFAFDLLRIIPQRSYLLSTAGGRWVAGLVIFIFRQHHITTIVVALYFYSKMSIQRIHDSSTVLILTDSRQLYYILRRWLAYYKYEMGIIMNGVTNRSKVGKFQQFSKNQKIPQKITEIGHFYIKQVFKKSICFFSYYSKSNHCKYLKCSLTVYINLFLMKLKKNQKSLTTNFFYKRSKFKFL
ncbi:hypothetical protein AGLY_008982 [Aphis glycines]|uniref:Uncharacterized protein n=1 Tax=Aphis glycines TaxID=307491 RepID=A0A6G0TJN0_APHGL|nr:hypothetical protein AGLY_008982 [Aphis glycines]